MRGIFIVAGLAASAYTATVASAPGQPLDCSDLVSPVPGLTVTRLSPPQCPADHSPVLLCWLNGSNTVVDNEGQLIGMDMIPAGGTCGSSPLHSVRVVRLVGGQEQVLATMQERCLSTEPDVVEVGGPAGLLFDSVKGRLFVWITSDCLGGECPYPQTYGACAIDGFVTLRRVLRAAAP